MNKLVALFMTPSLRTFSHPRHIAPSLWLFILTLGVGSTTTTPGIAEEIATDPASARELFDQGRKLMHSGDYSVACPLLEKSQHLHSGIGTQFNLAKCLEELGRTASAWQMYLDVAQQTQALGQTAREAVARERVSALEPQLSRLTLQVSNPSPQQKITLNGIPVASETWDKPAARDPLTYKLIASAPNRQPWESQVDISAGQRLLVVEVPELLPIAAPTAKYVPVPLSDPSAEQTDWNTPSNWLLLGGAGSLIASVVVGLKASRTNERAKSICWGFEDLCPGAQIRENSDLRDDAESARTAAFLLGALSTVSIATGLWLWLEDESPAGSQSKLSLTLALDPSPRNAQLAARWSF